MGDNINRTQQEKYEKLWSNEWHNLHKIGPGARSRNRILLRYFKKFIQTGSIFDSGCGDGSLLLLLHNNFQGNLIYHAGDISETAIAKVKKFEFIDEATIIDIENPSSLPKRKFTVVVSSEVLEHVERWQNSLRHLGEIVEDQGFLFITVPAQMKFWSSHDNFAKHFRRFELGQIELGQIEIELTNSVLFFILTPIKESWCWGKLTSL